MGPTTHSRTRVTTARSYARGAGRCSAGRLRGPQLGVGGLLGGRHASSDRLIDRREHLRSLTAARNIEEHECLGGHEEGQKVLRTFASFVIFVVNPEPALDDFFSNLPG